MMSPANNQRPILTPLIVIHNSLNFIHLSPLPTNQLPAQDFPSWSSKLSASLYINYGYKTLIKRYVVLLNSLDIPSSVAQLAAMATTQEYPMTASSSNGGVAAGAVLFSSKDQQSALAVDGRCRQRSLFGMGISPPRCAAFQLIQVFSRKSCSIILGLQQQRTVMCHDATGGGVAALPNYASFVRCAPRRICSMVGTICTYIYSNMFFVCEVGCCTFNWKWYFG